MNEGSVTYSIAHKHKLGDYVYYMADNKVHTGYVCLLTIHQSFATSDKRNTSLRITYRLNDTTEDKKDHCHDHPEATLFATKADLLASL